MANGSVEPNPSTNKRVSLDAIRDRRALGKIARGTSSNKRGDICEGQSLGEFIDARPHDVARRTLAEPVKSARLDIRLTGA